MRMIDADAVERALPFDALVDALDAMFRDGCEVPVRHHHAIGSTAGAGGTLLLMPAWQTDEVIGVKIVSVFADNAKVGLPSVQGVYLVLDGTTGAVQALLDAARLTVRRTAAASGLAGRYLARADATRMLMVGAGALAPNVVRAHASQRPIEEVRVWNRTAARARALADELARDGFRAPVEADLDMPVPESGTRAASGCAEESGIPFGQGYVKNAYVGRTFIQPSQTLRQLGIRLKLNALEHMIRGKKIVVVDDSIVRGNTQRAQVRMLREAGALEVHVRISSPPVKWPCFYGIDFATRAELIANGLDADEIAASVGADSLGYISLDGMVEATGQPESALCTACFTGEYPIELPDESQLGKHLLETSLSTPTFGKALPVLNNP